MPDTTDPFRLLLHPLRLRVLEVRHVERPTPKVARVTLTGAALDGFITLSPEDHVKVFFPRDGETDPVMPVLGPNGLQPPPARSRKPIGRDFTPRSYHAARHELVLEFFLHGRGPASRWAAQASPGQRLGVAGPRGSRVLEAARDWHLLIGDETAQPEIARRLEELPEGVPAIAVLEIAHVSERRELTARPGQTIHWVESPADTRSATGPLLAAVTALELPAGCGQVWAAGEVEEVRAIYGHFVHARGLPQEQIHVSGHWRRGVANHDHHVPIES